MDRRRALSIFAWAWTVATPASACRFKARPWEAALEAATTTFVGTVEASSNDRTGAGASVPAVFLIERSLKGALAAGSRVQVQTDGSSCGLGFVRGQRWLVLAGGVPLASNGPSGSLLLRSESGQVMTDNEAFVARRFAVAR